MNILVLSDAFWPDHTGGISKSLLSEVKEFVARGHRVIVVTRRLRRNFLLHEMREMYGSDLTIISPQVISNVIHQITDGVSLFIRIIAMVSLLVASVGIITTLHTSVLERIKEIGCLLYTSPSPRDLSTSRMPSSA